MQGRIKLKQWMLVFTLLLSACSTTQTTQVPLILQAPEVPGAVEATGKILQFDNCSVGCPLGGSDVTLDRQAYTLNNNRSTKFANWVAYKITRDSPASGRSRNWAMDPDLPAADTLGPDDYKGASAALQIDRGHQANLASMGGVPDWQALNYLSNITPQKKSLNQGAWEKLENKERMLSQSSDVEAVYVITGPLYEHPMGTLPAASKHHVIPSGYWKVIVVGRTPEEGLYAAFIMQQETPRSADFCTYQVTVEQVEKRSGLTFWNSLSPDAQVALKSKQGLLPAKIGCPA